MPNAKKNKMTRYLFIIITLITGLRCFGSDRHGIVISNDSVIIYDTTNIKSKQIGYLLSGEIVDILDTTKSRFEIGTGYDSLCKQFPFVRVKNISGKIGWVSGQLIFRIIDNQNEYFGNLIKAKTDFSFNNHDYIICLGKNYGIGVANEIGLTGCDAFYPLLLYDKTVSKYYLIENLGNPNSTFKYCCLISDMGVGEELIDIDISIDVFLFKIKCGYQIGTGTYDTKIFFKDQKFYGKSIDIKRKYE